ncbi:Leucine aminopeptidase A [Colletotrichum fructicola]|uniref:Peptide hydrolase n=1 Tax=Colletotrichum fructicola (strain Nara gc5) TaxID=1213859 RepID=L2FWF6_COLFN|nr:Leucine aminopeptidase A [Colletotrichum fructicola]KAE9571474.1 Leucine aminopeptidase A [Colletotrichum fructicola]KAF4421859.1 Leucine aminopeptidase A [Colletotrichum fructicola]KAF4488835.1 Leucine aminopeptidase A [Colletotrichum fructicola Nara gc5]KAF4881575.1 Leucine aminopeptidase A [Colletotrichum fructicola]
MRVTIFLAGLAASTATESIARDASKLFTLETAPGETVTVTEEEKWEMMDKRIHFFDITEWPDAPAASTKDFRLAAALPFPTEMNQTSHVNALIPKLDKSRMQAHLERFSAFHNRYYLSRTGVESAEWLFGQISAIVDAAGHPTANVRYVRHTAWSQPSIIVTIPGQNQRTVVVGAHLDSVISGDRGAGRAPGADDNGSGSVMILEVLRVALTDPRIAAGELLNTVEFHWYGAEEAGLLGSQDIFTQYNASRRQVVAMLNQDMVGYVGRDGVERFGVVTDWVDLDQVAFMKRVIDAYTDIPYEETVCGYACSDHASANRNGYPSSFIFEAPFGNHNPYIHTPNDTIEHVSFDHALQHAKMTTGFVFELAYWPFA